MALVEAIEGRIWINVMQARAGKLGGTLNTAQG